MSRTSEQLRREVESIYIEAIDAIKNIIIEKGYKCITPQNFFAFEYNLGHEDNRDIMVIYADGSCAVSDWDGEEEDELCDLSDMEEGEIFGLLSSLEKGEFDFEL